MEDVLSKSSMVSSTDRLWIDVANYMVAKYGDKNCWHHTANRNVLCELCQEKDGGAMIKCFSERCHKEYHLDCAFQEGGFILEDSGKLTFHCENPFKPILFCICKEAYDENKAMICCDECGEWYHCTCVGMNPSDAANCETYTCPQCKQILREGKSPSATLKQKNAAKEHRSTCHQTAIKALELLFDLTGTVCPIIDYMSQLVPKNGNMAGDASARITCSRHPLVKYEELLEFISNPSFDASANIDGEDIERFGTDNLVAEWRQFINGYVDQYMHWLQLYEQRFQYIVQSVETASLDSSAMPLFASHLESLVEVETRLPLFPPSDTEFYLTFYDSLKWILDLLQVYL